MAKRKRSKTKARGRRVGARSSKSSIAPVVQMAALAVVGGVGVQWALSKFAPNMTSTVKGAIQVGAGALVAIAGRRYPAAIGFGVGSAVVGGENLMRGFGVIAGPTYYVPRPKMIAGPNNVNQLVAGNGVASMVAGDGVARTVAGPYRRGKYY